MVLLSKISACGAVMPTVIFLSSLPPLSPLPQAANTTANVNTKIKPNNFFKMKPQFIVYQVYL